METTAAYQSALINPKILRTAKLLMRSQDVTDITVLEFPYPPSPTMQVKQQSD
jgi:hypothetical protein